MKIDLTSRNLILSGVAGVALGGLLVNAGFGKAEPVHGASHNLKPTPDYQIKGWQLELTEQSLKDAKIKGAGELIELSLIHPEYGEIIGLYMVDGKRFPRVKNVSGREAYVSTGELSLDLLPTINSDQNYLGENQAPIPMILRTVYSKDGALSSYYTEIKVKGHVVNEARPYLLSEVPLNPAEKEILLKTINYFEDLIPPEGIFITERKQSRSSSKGYVEIERSSLSGEYGALTIFHEFSHSLEQRLNLSYMENAWESLRISGASDTKGENSRWRVFSVFTEGNYIAGRELPKTMNEDPVYSGAELDDKFNFGHPWEAPSELFASAMTISANLTSELKARITMLSREEKEMAYKVLKNLLITLKEGEMFPDLQVKIADLIDDN